MPAAAVLAAAGCVAFWGSSDPPAKQPDDDCGLGGAVVLMQERLQKEFEQSFASRDSVPCAGSAHREAVDEVWEALQDRMSDVWDRAFRTARDECAPLKDKRTNRNIDRLEAKLRKLDPLKLTRVGSDRPVGLVRQMTRDPATQKLVATETCGLMRGLIAMEIANKVREVQAKVTRELTTVDEHTPAAKKRKEDRKRKVKKKINKKGEQQYEVDGQKFKLKTTTREEYERKMKEAAERGEKTLDGMLAEEFDDDDDEMTDAEKAARERKRQEAKERVEAERQEAEERREREARQKKKKATATVYDVEDIDVEENIVVDEDGEGGDGGEGEAAGGQGEKPADCSDESESSQCVDPGAAGGKEEAEKEGSE